MARDARLIVHVARGGALERQLREDPPPNLGDGVVVDARPPDEAGRIGSPDAGRVVLSVPSPETLTREPAEVRRVIDGAGAGDEPLVVVIEAADELREEELAVILDAAGRSPRSVVLHVVGDG